MRIAIFAETYFPFISGVVTHIKTLKEGLEAEGHEVLIVTLSPTAKHHYVKDNVLYCPAIPLKKIYGYGVANPLNVYRLSILKKFNPDLLHIHTEFTMGIFALYAAKALKKPVVYTLHTMYDDYVFYLFPKKMNTVARPACHAYIRKIASKADAIIGPSHKVANYLEHCGVHRHINIVPNTVDVSAFLPENVDSAEVDALKTELGIQPDDVVLCFVGRLGQEKSIDVLIEYFAKNYAGNPRFKLMIMGDGPEYEALGKQIKKLKVDEQVRLLGRVEHNIIPVYYQACNLFATASVTEMNSISMLEATASGLYVVQRLDIYNRDQIKSGVNGDVFENTDDFKKIVDEYAGLNPAQRKERKASVSKFAQKYGTKEFTEAILDVYYRAQIDFHNKKKK